MFGLKMDEETGSQIRLHYEELHILYSSQYIIRMEMGRESSMHGRDMHTSFHRRT
jgi:hypothetical protein